MSQDRRDYEEVKNGSSSWQPAHGFEAECNMEGRYTFLVAEGIPTESIAICSLGVMGTTYVRDEPLPTSITLAPGERIVLAFQHVYAEDEIGNVLNIRMRQRVGEELSFVNIEDSRSYTDVIFDASNLVAG